MSTSTARSWDSYMDTLLAVLDEFKPKTVLEFGSGKSTGVMAMYPSVQRLITNEHDPEYFAQFNKSAFENLDMILVTNEDEYAYTFNKNITYDLIFVDGVNRCRCMRESRRYLSKNGVMILHDAAREQYQDAINEWPYKIWTDDGHTVCLFNSEVSYLRSKKILDTLKNTIGVKACE